MTNRQSELIKRWRENEKRTPSDIVLELLNDMKELLLEAKRFREKLGLD